MDAVDSVKVEDTPAGRTEPGYCFISNEVYVSFRTRTRRERVRRFFVLPEIVEQVLTLGGLEQALSAREEIGPPDYADAGMLQYLRTERIVPPYQTKGYKLVELVRIYQRGTSSRA